MLDGEWGTTDARPRRSRRQCLRSDSARRSPVLSARAAGCAAPADQHVPVPDRRMALRDGSGRVRHGVRAAVGWGTGRGTSTEDAWSLQPAHLPGAPVRADRARSSAQYRLFSRPRRCADDLDEPRARAPDPVCDGCEAGTPIGSFVRSCLNSPGCGIIVALDKDCKHGESTIMNTTHPIDDLLRQRILLLDGSMGVFLLRMGLEEKDYRGERFARHPVDLLNNPDILNLTRPEIIEGIHTAYLEAGADIIETNTFTATAIAQSEYQLEPVVYEMNVAAAQTARRAVEKAESLDPARPRFVAGSLGPLNRTLSLSRDVQDPGARDVTFDQVVNAFAEQVRGLLDGGVDLLLAETTFDTLNLKA